MMMSRCPGVFCHRSSRERLDARTQLSNCSPCRGHGRRRIKHFISVRELPCDAGPHQVLVGSHAIRVQSSAELSGRVRCAVGSISRSKKEPTLERDLLNVNHMTPPTQRGSLHQHVVCGDATVSGGALPCVSIRKVGAI